MWLPRSVPGRDTPDFGSTKVSGFCRREARRAFARANDFLSCGRARWSLCSFSGGTECAVCIRCLKLRWKLRG